MRRAGGLSPLLMDQGQFESCNNRGLTPPARPRELFTLRQVLSSSLSLKHSNLYALVKAAAGRYGGQRRFLPTSRRPRGKSMLLAAGTRPYSAAVAGLANRVGRLTLPIRGGQMVLG